MSDAHAIRSPETWAAVRDGFLAGISAPDLCERFDIPKSTFHARAAAEGWRKADRPDAPEPEFDLFALLDSGQPLRTAAQLAAAAWLGADRAIARGRAADAERWMRLHRQYRALVKEEEAEARKARIAETDRTIQTAKTLTAAAVAGRRETEAVIKALKAGVPLDRLDSLDQLSSPDPAPEPPPPDFPDSLDRVAGPAPDPHRLRRGVLQAALDKSLRRGDRPAAERIRAKLDALPAPDGSA